MKRGELITEQLQLDFIARLADAWDFRGDHIFRASGVEHRALLQLADLPIALERARWAELSGAERMKILYAARAVIQLARQCAWIFGEGRGAQ